MAGLAAVNNMSGQHTWQDTETRERIAGSPLVPNGVHWAEDGRIAVVCDSNIMISTFLNRELEMYVEQQHSPVSKSFIFVSDIVENEHIPLEMPVFDEPMDENVPSGALTHFFFCQHNRSHQHPKETSFSKNDGNSFVAAIWGPRGSGPNASCAMVTLTSTFRICLHFSSSFHLNWKEVEVFSEKLYHFFNEQSFILPETVITTAKRPKHNSSNSGKTDNVPSERSISEYIRRCNLVSTLTVAWSPFVSNASTQRSCSFLAFSGRQASTIWTYDYPTFHTTDSVTESYLSSSPVAWIDTQQYGWITTSTWQEMSRKWLFTTNMLQLALGSTSGNILLVSVPVEVSDNWARQLPVDKVITTPHQQPAYCIRLGSKSTFGDSLSNNLIAASGSLVSVWNCKKKRPQPKSWKAHNGNVTGLDIDYSGELIFSCGADGMLKAWEKETTNLVEFGTYSKVDVGSNGQNTAKYPLFGLCASPSSVQVAFVHIIPPAAKPNRKSQADVSYTRVSSALELLPSPRTTDLTELAAMIFQVLGESGRTTSLLDVVWMCHHDNQAQICMDNVSDLNIPTLLNKLRGGNEDLSIRAPLYEQLCKELERCYFSESEKLSSNFDPPLLLQASYFLRSCILPAESDAAAHKTALANTRRHLYAFWAVRCLKELLATHRQVDSFIELSMSERVSALQMADFLSIQSPMTDIYERLVTTIYNSLGSEENSARWMRYLQERSAHRNETDLMNSSIDNTRINVLTPPIPPPRQTCFICDQPIRFGELELFCTSGHAQDRCFLSFQCTSSTDTWKCMGCGAVACEIDLSRGVSPFYLLESHSSNIPTTRELQVLCRLCGNFCTFFKY